MSAGAGSLGAGRLPALGRAALLPFGILAIVMLMVVPIPTFLLDLFFIFNIMVALAVLMVAIKAEKPLDFSVFPTVLLFATLLRLALNVASTRVVLVAGHTGTDAAGHVIEAFGNFLIGGDFIVGLFVFMILMIINMVVITKGAGRVSEVSARFTLDALPGKQMAIDADLNAGLLTAEEAKARRAEVATEADFYGSMDGASKFVKGDAVAALLILIINVVGGLLLGVLQHDLSLSEAASLYILLAIGDGLVAQVPALLLSIAAALIVTRVTSPFDLTGQMTSQFGAAGAWAPVAAILALLGLLPGMPHLIVLGAAAIAGFVAWRLSRKASAETATGPVEAGALELVEPHVSWEEVTDHAQAGLELGYGLIGLADGGAAPAPLIARVTGVRKQLSRELGFVLPQVRVRDNMGLPPSAYRILVGGVAYGEDEVQPDDFLALDAGTVIEPVAGRPVKDPSFGLDALWIGAQDRDLATANGYTVVDASTVVATHLSQVLRAQAHRLLGQDDVQRLLDALQPTAPQLISGLIGKTLQLPTLTSALQLLLEEGVPIREFRRLLEAAGGAAARTSDPVELVELMRPALGDLIVSRLAGVREPLRVLSFEGGLEAMLAASVRADPASPHPFEPGLARRVTEAAAEAAGPLVGEGVAFAVVVSPLIRRAVYRLLRARLPGVPVLSFLEIPEAKPVSVIGTIAGTPALAAA